jgi:hypothetical protein
MYTTKREEPKNQDKRLSSKCDHGISIVIEENAAIVDGFWFTALAGRKRDLNLG